MQKGGIETSTATTATTAQTAPPTLYLRRLACETIPEQHVVARTAEQVIGTAAG
jgi:hypothetical protein